MARKDVPQKEDFLQLCFIGSIPQFNSFLSLAKIT
jgi:hypothetical protein